MKKAGPAFLLLFFLVSVAAALESEAPAKKNSLIFPKDDFAAVLKSHTDSTGMVDYKSLKRDSAMLYSFLGKTSHLLSAAYNRLDRNERLAYWINVYNAQTMKVIIDNYPKKSIQEIKGAWDRITFMAAGRKLTLDGLENDILRKEFNEPRIHMALVCAAVSCPPLRSEPYSGEKLEEQLADQSRRFLADPGNFRIDAGQGVLYLSSIFKWFGDDFARVYGQNGRFKEYGSKDRALMDFISANVVEDVRSALVSGKWKIKFMDYNWALNERKPKNLD